MHAQFGTPASVKSSDKALIIFGVPQGSILGSLLLLLYVNDMVQAVNGDLLLYAGNTGLIFQDPLKIKQYWEVT